MISVDKAKEASRINADKISEKHRKFLYKVIDRKIKKASRKGEFYICISIGKRIKLKTFINAIESYKNKGYKIEVNHYKKVAIISWEEYKQ